MNSGGVGSWRSRRRSEAISKPVSCTSPVSLTRILSGLVSLWTRPPWWTCFTAPKQIARRHAGAETPSPDGALCERAPLLAHLRSGYALPTLRQQRHILIRLLHDSHPRFSHPEGVIIGRERGSRLEAI